MQTITTYNGIALLLVENQKEKTDRIFVVYNDILKTWVLEFQYENETVHKLLNNNSKECYLIGTTLTDEQVEPFVEVLYIKNQPNIAGREKWFKDYINMRTGWDFTKFTPLESWKSLLEANNIDLSKEWVVLQIKNN
jgi:hypothetical protein